jgi:hypothetical protein
MKVTVGRGRRNRQKEEEQPFRVVSSIWNDARGAARGAFCYRSSPPDDRPDACARTDGWMIVMDRCMDERMKVSLTRGYRCVYYLLGEVIVLLRILAVALDELALDETLDTLF